MADLIGRLNRALQGRYAVERELGRGGMATVYLARDIKHDRPVALKVLRPEVASTLGEERFLREIRFAAGLSHPHILTLHDSGSADGLLYFVMPHVEGESLRDQLRRERQLALSEALAVTRQLASALDYAHRRGVIHRDVKPENVLLHEGQALLSDFGIARAMDAAGADRLTAVGVTVGTPEYMSPEQAAADRELDRRSDVYGLACVLYEMLAGDPPFSGANANAILARKAVEPAPSLRTVRDGVSEAIERVVMKALARSPADRFATTEEFAQALDAAASAGARLRAAGRITSTATAATLALASVAAWAYATRPLGASAPTSIAVLPCKSAVEDPARAYLGEVITEDLIAQASKSRLFEKVIAPSSVVRYRATTEQPQEIGAALGVAVLLFCEYRQSGLQERLRAQLVDSRSGALLWTDDFERDLTAGNAAQLPALVVNGLAEAVGADRPAARGLRKGRATTDDLRALNLYKEGRYFLTQLREDAVRRSIVLFRESIARDSMFALPYAGLARAYYVLGLGHGSLDEREAFALLKEAAGRALALDEQIAEAHELLGAYELDFGWNWRLAERRFRRAIELDPSLASAHQQLGSYLSYMGRHDEAFARSARAIDLSPVDPILWGEAGVVRYLAGRYDEALPYLAKGLELAPQSHPDHWAIGAVYAEMGDTRRAIDHLRRADSLSGHQVAFRGYLAYAYGLAGDSAAARAILLALKRGGARPRQSGKAAAAIAVAHIGLGERDSAFTWLNAAYQERSGLLAFVLLAPVGQRLESDPRYDALLRRVGLPRPAVVRSRM